MWFALRICDPPSVERHGDKDAMHQLSAPPPKWSLEADEELAKFMADHVNKHEAFLGNASRYVESVQVSSVSASLYRLGGMEDNDWLQLLKELSSQLLTIALPQSNFQ